MNNFVENEETPTSTDSSVWRGVANALLLSAGRWRSSLGVHTYTHLVQSTRVFRNGKKRGDTVRYKTLALLCPLLRGLRGLVSPRSFRRGVIFFLTTTERAAQSSITAVSEKGETYIISSAPSIEVRDDRYCCVARRSRRQTWPSNEFLEERKKRLHPPEEPR